jgi:hypothetical protein
MANSNNTLGIFKQLDQVPAQQRRVKMTKAYLVTASDSEGVVAKRYAGTQSDAKTTRDELVEQFSVKKSDVTIEDAEIPYSKVELIEFINELCAESDWVEEEGESS